MAEWKTEHPFNKLPCNAQLTVTTCPDMVKPSENKDRRPQFIACNHMLAYSGASWSLPAPDLSNIYTQYCPFHLNCSSSRYHYSSFQRMSRSRSVSQLCDRYVDRASHKQRLPGRTAKGQVAARKGRSNPALMAFLVRIPGIQTTRRAHDSVPI